MDKKQIIAYLKSKKEFLKTEYGITTIGIYGSYARDEANKNSDLDIFYERKNNFELKSGLDFLHISNVISEDLCVKHVDFVRLETMNPIIKYYAQKDFIYV
ncbi:MAG: hypothetical protein DRR08_33260 [Candidatus Parabeggiatoa sp. nov. 2]|nr:MAG: hypothetical protein DRR08_33260 [Gammaproteobacteria bacterium]